MDDLFNDGVPPPDSQSNPEQEADNDEVSHDDVPDKIPSSGLDTILDFNEEDNRLLEQLKREKRSLSSYDGFLESELSHRRIPYHIIRIDNTPWDVGQAHYLALLGARLSCDVIDIFRGRRKPAHVERILTEDCMRRLKTASGLLINHMKEDIRLHARFGLLPINVFMVSGWLVSPTKFECTALLNIGELRLSCNTTFVLKGSVWKCTVADFG